MRGKMNTSNYGNKEKVSIPAPSGHGVPKRDSAVATGTSSGGGTLRYRSGQVKRSSFGMGKYK